MPVTGREGRKEGGRLEQPSMPTLGDATCAALCLVREVSRFSAAGFTGFFKEDCTGLARKVSMLANLLEDVGDSKRIPVNCNASDVLPACFSGSSFADLTLALQAAKRLVAAANNSDYSDFCLDGAAKKIRFQFQFVTLKLEKALANLPYSDFDLSEEVLEQVELVRSQLRCAVERYGGPLSSKLLDRDLSHPLDKEISPFQTGNRLLSSLRIKDTDNIDKGGDAKLKGRVSGELVINHASDEFPSEERLHNLSPSKEISLSKDHVNEGSNVLSCNSVEENKKPDSFLIPDDFRCPISLEIMRDPVVVATGQTYDRAYIQRWIDSGNTTCPKTGQKLQHLTLIPNHALRSLISQWCEKHNIGQPITLVNGKIMKSDGTFRDITGDIAAIGALVRKLSSSSIEECRAAVAEIRTLTKRSTDNRILFAEAGAIPILVGMLTSTDCQIQDNAVTCILNLSIYDNNKGLIMLANAVPLIVLVLRSGSTEARENAAATLFCLSHAEENKIIIGASGAITALVNLLQNGSARGQKDAVAALFNLCTYHGNKGRAVRAGIITALATMLTDSSNCMIDEALTILSLLSSHHETKQASFKAGIIPVLVDLLQTASPRNKENAAAILLCLCRRDSTILACVCRLGAQKGLAELAMTGTERAKRKATSLLEQLCKYADEQHDACVALPSRVVVT